MKIDKKLIEYAENMKNNIFKNLEKTTAKQVCFKEISKNYNHTLLEKSRICFSHVFPMLKNSHNLDVSSLNSHYAKHIPIILAKFLGSSGVTTTKKRLMEDFNLTKNSYQTLMEQLKKNRWLIIIGKYHEINPFLQYLYSINNDWIDIVTYWRYDLFDLFSIPLLEAKKHGCQSLNVYWYKINHEKAYFEGHVFFELWITKDLPLYTVLPINIHYAGSNPHITLPFPKSVLEVEGTKRTIKEIIVDGKINKIHFDNSISLSLAFKGVSWLNWRMPYLILRNADKYSRSMRKEIQKSGIHERVFNKEFYRMYQHDYEFFKRYWDGKDYIEFNNPQAFEQILKTHLRG